MAKRVIKRILPKLPKKKTLLLKGKDQKVKASRGPQVVDDKPQLVRHLFDRMSLMESNFNQCFDSVDEYIAHLQYDVHYLYERQGYACQYALFVHYPPSPAHEGE